MHDPWSSRPSAATTSRVIDLVRVPIGGGIKCHVLSVELVGAYTHYWRGRTAVCDGDTCEACRASRIPRWYGFLCACNEAKNKIILLEVTPTCVPAIDLYQEAHGSLRGAKIGVRRANRKPNSRLICELERGPFADGELPPSCDVRAQLERMWEVKHYDRPGDEVLATGEIPEHVLNGLHNRF